MVIGHTVIHSPTGHRLYICTLHFDTYVKVVQKSKMFKISPEKCVPQNIVLNKYIKQEPIDESTENKFDYDDNDCKTTYQCNTNDSKYATENLEAEIKTEVDIIGDETFESFVKIEYNDVPLVAPKTVDKSNIRNNPKTSNFKTKASTKIKCKVISSKKNDKKPYKCNTCNKSYLHKSSLYKHSKIHKGEKPYECDICKKSFLRKEYLKRHTKIHFKNHKSKFKCGICNENFSYASKFNRHKMIHKPGHDVLKPYRCHICLKSFAQLSYLCKHKIIHRTHKPFICAICNKSFFQKHSIKKHIRIHTGEKPYKCLICTKSFSDVSNLNRHKLIHKPYDSLNLNEFNTCNKSFSQKHDLTIHIKVHKGKKVFKCLQCDKSYAYLSNLMRHKIIHESCVLLYKCDICNKSFSRKWQVKSHIQIHMEEKRFKCAICEKSFVRKEHIKNHLRNHKI